MAVSWPRVDQLAVCLARVRLSQHVREERGVDTSTAGGSIGQRRKVVNDDQVARGAQERDRALNARINSKDDLADGRTNETIAAPAMTTNAGSATKA